MTTAAIPAENKKSKKVHPNLPSGHPVRFRLFQKLIWVGLAAVLGVGFIAGLYYLGLEQDYHNVIPALPVHTSAKTWWDGGMGFIHNNDWTNGLWRHGVRDKAEPEMWAVVGGILLGASMSRHRIRLPFLILGALTMFVLIIAGALFITWFTAFGPAKDLHGQWQNIVAIVLGFIVGHILHYLWMPMANSVRYQLVSFSLHRSENVPLWVTLPLAPPAWREMWSQMHAEGVGAEARAERKAKVNRFHQSRFIVPVFAFLFLLIAVAGILAKYPIAHGVHIPVMNP